MRATGATVELIRLKEGTYQIGGSTRKLFIRILHTNIMVRVGGGWQTLKSWLSSHGANIKGTPSAAQQGLDARRSRPFEQTTIMVGKQKYVSGCGRPVTSWVSLLSDWCHDLCARSACVHCRTWRLCPVCLCAWCACPVCVCTWCVYALCGCA